MILAIIEDRYPIFAMLFIQLRGKVIEDEWLYQEKGVNFFLALMQEVNSSRFYVTEYLCGYKPSLGAMIWPYEREEPIFRQVQLVKKVIDSWEEI
jgi:hypothetical protein